MYTQGQYTTFQASDLCVARVLGDLRQRCLKKVREGQVFDVVDYDEAWDGPVFELEDLAGHGEVLDAGCEAVVGWVGIHQATPQNMVSMGVGIREDRHVSRNRKNSFWLEKNCKLLFKYIFYNTFLISIFILLFFQCCFHYKFKQANQLC